MQAECLPFAQLPGTSRLFLDYVSGKVGAPFYPSTAGYLPSQARKDFPDERRKRVAEILAVQNRELGASAKTSANIARLAAGASAVVTGQQVTLFGGPAFAIYKALTAISIAEELSKRGVESVPIFWLATQDHDFAEVQSTLLRSPAGELRSFSLAATAPADTPVGKIKLGPQIEALARDAAEFLGGEFATILRECYRPEETLGSAMGRLFATIFGDHGLIVVDPLHPELARLAAPVYQEVVKKRDELDRRLLERGKELEAAGYHQQVKVTPSSTLLFVEINGARTPLRRANGNFAAGEKRYTETQLIQYISNSPETISGNALLRPVVQDYLLPTVAYIGGPAEVAYFAQAAVVYEKLLGRVTPIVPRFSATILDARDQRLLAEYGLSLRDVIEHDAKLGEALAARKLGTDVEQEFTSAQRKVEDSLCDLEKQLRQLDATLADAAKHSRSKIEYQLSRLRSRAACALLRRSEELKRHAESLRKSLFPHGELQERQVAGISYLARFGEDLLRRLESAARSDCKGHHVIRL